MAENDKGALERYLAKRGIKPNTTSQNDEGLAEPNKQIAENDFNAEESLKAQASSLPHIESAPGHASEATQEQSQINSNVSPAPPPQTTLSQAVVPGGFWARFFAYVVDGIILWTLRSILVGAWWVSFGLIFHSPLWGLNPLIYFVVSYFYYGYFYSTKRASPGKMLLGLEIQDTLSNLPLGYWRIFFRETVGKAISGCILAIGFLMVLVRQDKRALHDLLFDTRVVHRTRLV